MHIAYACMSISKEKNEHYKNLQERRTEPPPHSGLGWYCLGIGPAPDQI